jgi:hypothetical protein
LRPEGLGDWGMERAEGNEVTGSESHKKRASFRLRWSKVKLFPLWVTPLFSISPGPEAFLKMLLREAPLELSLRSTAQTNSNS